MRIRWTPPAVEDLQGISEYLKAHHPNYRQPTMRKLYERIRGLREAPYAGRPGRVEETREVLVPPLPYIIVYRVRNGTIEIWRIYHGAQNR